MRADLNLIQFTRSCHLSLSPPRPHSKAINSQIAPSCPIAGARRSNKHRLAYKGFFNPRLPPPPHSLQFPSIPVFIGLLFFSIWYLGNCLKAFLSFYLEDKKQKSFQDFLTGGIWKDTQKLFCSPEFDEQAKFSSPDFISMK